MRRIAASLALIGAIVVTLCAAPFAGAAVPAPPQATATVSGDSIVVVTLSEPIASFPAGADRTDGRQRRAHDPRAQRGRGPVGPDAA